MSSGRSPPTATTWSSRPYRGALRELSRYDREAVESVLAGYHATLAARVNCKVRHKL
jgi:hypothetical protein